MSEDVEVEVADASTLRLMVATDTHLGYLDRDVVRRDDSFVSFEEVLVLSKQYSVDALLLGGDLFHENKPSRQSQSQATCLLNQHVLGNRALSLNYLSQPEVDFAHTSLRSPQNMNWLNPNLNIDLPILVVHGNHDDPSGPGGLSCLDPLHASGLINYIGKTDSLDQLTLSPLLLSKDNTKVALFPMGAMKDERLHKLFRSGKVEFLRPEEDASNGQAEWFNLCVVHQNRVKHGESNYLPEAFLPDFLHLIIWGHEHECRIEPEVKMGGSERVFITQPGSSVATSLSEGEAKGKHVAILDIKGTQFKLTPIPLKTVRPFIFRSLSLDSCQGLDLKTDSSKMSSKSNKQRQLEIENYLKAYVEELLETELPSLLTGHPNQPQLPLVRVRVEYSEEWQQLTPGLFGNNFEGRVANAEEILLFRRKSKQLGQRNKEDEADIKEDVLDAILQIQEEDEQLPSMENFITDYFSSVEDERAQLRLLGSLGIKASMKSFVEKDERHAIEAIVDLQLTKTLEHVVNKVVSSSENAQEYNDDDHELIDESIDEYQQQRELNEADFDDALNKKPTTNTSNENNGDDNVENDMAFEDDHLRAQEYSQTNRRGQNSRTSRVSRGSSRGAARASKRQTNPALSPVVTRVSNSTARSTNVARNSRGSGRGNTGLQGSTSRTSRQSTITDAFGSSSQRSQRSVGNRRGATQSSGRSIVYDSDSE